SWPEEAEQQDKLSRPSMAAGPPRVRTSPSGFVRPSSTAGALRSPPKAASGGRAGPRAAAPGDPLAECSVQGDRDPLHVGARLVQSLLERALLRVGPPLVHGASYALVNVKRQDAGRGVVRFWRAVRVPLPGCRRDVAGARDAFLEDERDALAAQLDRGRGPAV